MQQLFVDLVCESSAHLDAGRIEACDTTLSQSGTLLQRAFERDESVSVGGTALKGGPTLSSSSTSSKTAVEIASVKTCVSATNCLDFCHQILAATTNGVSESTSSLCLAAIKILIIDALATSNSIALVESVSSLCEQLTSLLEAATQHTASHTITAASRVPFNETALAKALVLTLMIRGYDVQTDLVAAGGSLAPSPRLQRFRGNHDAADLIFGEKVRGLLDHYASTSHHHKPLTQSLAFHLLADAFQHAALHVKPASLSGPRTGFSDGVKSRCHAALSETGLVGPAAKILLLSSLWESWTSSYHQNTNKEDVSSSGGDDVVELTVSALTHSIQLGKLRHHRQEDASPLLQELHHATTAPVAALLASFLISPVPMDVKSTVSKSTEGAVLRRSPTVHEMNSQRVQQCFSYQHEWKSAKFEPLLLSALALGLAELHATLLAIQWMPQKPLTIQSLPFAQLVSVQWFPADRLSSLALELHTETGSTTTTSSSHSYHHHQHSSSETSNARLRSALALLPAGVDTTVSVDCGQVLPQNIRLTTMPRLATHNCMHPSMTIRFADQSVPLLVSMVHSHRSHLNISTTSDGATSERSTTLYSSPARSPSPQRKSIRSPEQVIAEAHASNEDPFAATECCSRCEAIVARRSAALESRMAEAEAQRDELVDCVSSLRSDVELTNNHVVVPLQAEVAALREKLASVQHDLLLSVTVVKELSQENEDLHASLRQQHHTVERIVANQSRLDAL